MHGDHTLTTERAGLPRQWTVVAAIVHTDHVGVLPVGVVVARDLDMAAEQVCAHLAPLDAADGTCFLVATPATMGMEAATGRLVVNSRFAWVNQVQYDGVDVTLSEWVPAAGRLALPDPPTTGHVVADSGCEPTAAIDG